MKVANQQSLIVSIFLLIIIVGCLPANRSISTQLNIKTHHPLAWDRLGNLNYKLFDHTQRSGMKEIDLQNGLFLLDSATRQGFILDDFVAYGDLNGDAAEDATVVLLQQSAEGEIALHLYPILNQQQRAHPLIATEIGRNLVIQSLTIEQNIISLTYQQRESYVRWENRYRLEGGRAIKIGQQQLSSDNRPNPPQPRILQLGRPVQDQSDVTGINPYTFEGQAGDPLTIMIQSPYAASFLSIIGADGTVIQSIRNRANEWQGQLPTTQSYTINVVSFGSELDFTLVASKEEVIANSAWTPRPTNTPLPTWTPHSNNWKATPQGKWTPKPTATPRPGGGKWTPRPTTTPRPGGGKWTPRPTTTPQPGGETSTPLPTTTPQPKPVAPAQRDPNVIYLTFDDGPYPKYTNQIKTLLDQYGAKASFFVIGRVAQYHMDTIDQISRAGHVIANHTWDHYALDQLDRDGFYYQILTTQNLLGGYETRCLRPPFGAINSIGRAYAAELGYVVMLWEVDTRDWGQIGADAIINTTLSYADGGEVILFHDGGGDRSQTVTALQTILPALRDRGYRFETIRSLCSKN